MRFDVEIEQVGDAVEDGLFDGVLVGFEEIHRPVKVLQLEVTGAGDVHVLLEPLLVAVELGSRGAGAIRDHREQRPFEVEAEALASLDMKNFADARRCHTASST